VRPAFERLEAGEDFIDAFNAQAARRGLRNHRGLPIRFVPQAALPDTAYEEFIGATGRCRRARTCTTSSTASYGRPSRASSAS
jgi:hypothetical protein